MPKKPIKDSYKHLQKKTVHVERAVWEDFGRIARRHELVSYQHALALLSTFTFKEAEELDDVAIKTIVEQREFVRAHQDNKEKVAFVSLFVPKEEERRTIDEVVRRVRGKDKGFTLSDLLRYVIHRAVEQEGADIDKMSPIKKEGVERIQVNLWAKDYQTVLKHAKKQDKTLYAYFLDYFPSFTDAQFWANHIARTPGPKRVMSPDKSGLWTAEPLRVKNGQKITPEMKYDLINKSTLEVFPCPSTGWKFPQAVVDVMNREGNILWPARKNGKVCYKKFLADKAEFQHLKTQRTFITLYPTMHKKLEEQAERLGVEKHEVLRAFVRYLAHKFEGSPKTDSE